MRLYLDFIDQGKQNFKFILDCSYDEREVPKAAKFRWDPSRKVWWTDQYNSVIALQKFADSSAKETIESITETRQKNLDLSSKAVSSSLTLEHPDNLPYFPYQEVGIEYSLDKRSVLIADEMGLGKTIQAIGIINNTQNINRVLVICPASLKINWEREIKKWLIKDLSVGIVDKKIFPDTDIVIINYDIVKKFSSKLKEGIWDIMIVDEAHALKNPKAQRTGYILGKWDSDPVKSIPPIKAARKVFLTGTPILNRPVELWPIVQALDPTGLGRNWKYFVQRYCGAYQGRWGWDTSGATNLGELQDQMRSKFMVRRLKRDVLKELPPKIRQVVELPSNGAISAVKKEVIAWEKNEQEILRLKALVEIAKASEKEEEYKEAVETLRNCVQVAFEEMSTLRYETAMAKVPVAVDYLLDVLESVDKVVVFAHHRDVIDKISNTLIEKDVKNVVLTGATKEQDRQAAVDEFQNNSDCKVFVGSIKAAGVGITLTQAATVLFFELDWTPGIVTQAEDRCHRIGTTQTVLIQHLVLDGSLDVKMANTLISKQQVIETALDKEYDISLNVVIPTIKSSSDSLRRQDIQERAKKISPEDISLIHEGLKILAHSCDGAYLVDGQGYNKIDSAIGHSLASQTQLSPAQAILGFSLIHKYRKQIPNIIDNITIKGV